MNNESASAADIGDKDDEGEMKSDDEQESRVPKSRRAPNEPTNEEIRLHEVTHTPYRSWCPCCVSGRGKADSHFKSSGEEKGEEKAVAGIHVDYWFLRDEKGGESTPVLVAKDDTTKAFAAHVVFQKGNIDWVADRIIDDIDKFGHSSKVCIKSDQEPALVDLVRAVKTRRSGETFLTTPSPMGQWRGQSKAWRD